MQNVLLVTVTKVEAQTVLGLSLKFTGTKPERRFIEGKAYYALGQIGGVNTFMVRSEMGTSAPGAALLTIHKAIEVIAPIAIIMVGIAFGVNPNEQHLGDILVSKQLQAYEPQKIKRGHKAIPRGDRVTASPRMLDTFRDGELDWQGAKVHFGLILSGEKLINDQIFRDELLAFEPEAIGGDMEGSGLYAAAQGTKVDWILVKAICDWADGNKSDDHQQVAASNAVSFVFHVIQKGGLNFKSTIIERIIERIIESGLLALWSGVIVVALALVIFATWWIGRHPQLPNSGSSLVLSTPDTSIIITPVVAAGEPSLPPEIPTETPEPNGPLIDTFDTNKYSWPTGSTAEIRDGVYYLTANDRSIYVWSMTREWDDFQIEVDLNFQDSTQVLNAAGVVFRVSQGTDGNSFYSFLINTDGYFALGRVLDNNWSQLIPWTPVSSSFNSNGMNRVAIHANGDTFWFTLNGQGLTTITDNSLASGWIGFTADSGTHVAFDNLEVAP